MASQIFSLPGVALLCVGEALLVTRVLPPQYSGSASFSKSFFVLLLIHLLARFLLWTVIYNFLISPLRRFPSPKESTFVLLWGHFATGKPPGTTFLKATVETPNDGIMLLKGVFTPHRLMVTKPNALADLLVANAYDFKKPGQIRDFLRHVLGNGLIIVEGDDHRFQRKHLLPAFNFRHIKDLYPMMWVKAQSLADRITLDIQDHPARVGDVKGPISGTTEINQWAGKITLDIIGVAGLGREINALKNSDDQLVKDYEELLEPAPEKLLFFLMKAFVSAKFTEMLPWKLNQTFARVTGSLRSNCHQMVREKRDAMKRGEQHFDILSVLIKSNDFSDDELADQLLTFLAAGHETTSSAFTWATYLLAKHRDVQSRLREEVSAALPADPLSDSTFDLPGVLEKLPLLNAICNETLRLYPTVPITIRVATRDSTICGNPIPRGTEILICPWAINRTPELWGPDADEFKPERWIDDGKPNNRGGAESNYSLMTFLHGPRSCIGQNFAKAELRCLLATFITTFEWELDMRDEDVIPAGVITIKPKNGLKVKLTKLA